MKTTTVEFEQSLLSVLEIKYPNSTLEGLPYWNWPNDVLRHDGKLEESSLWRLWGSPFGDPSNQYCIHDPVFQVQIAREGDLNTALLEDRLGPKLGDSLKNAAGLRRSPWSATNCPGIARNPGWVFGKETPLLSLWGWAAASGSSSNLKNHLSTVSSRLATRRMTIGDECLDIEHFTGFAACVQGSGYSPGKAEFGWHNIPHIYMGTLNDETHAGGSYLVVILSVGLSIASGLTVGLFVTIGLFTLYIAKWRARLGQGFSTY